MGNRTFAALCLASTLAASAAFANPAPGTRANLPPVVNRPIEAPPPGKMRLTVLPRFAYIKISMLLVAPPSAQNAEKTLEYRAVTKVCNAPPYTLSLVPSAQPGKGVNSMTGTVVDEANAHRIAKNLTDRKSCFVGVQVKVRDTKTGSETIVGTSTRNLYLDRPYFPDGYGDTYLTEAEYAAMKPILAKMNEANPTRTFTFYGNMLTTSTTPGIAVYLVAEGVKFDW